MSDGETVSLAPGTTSPDDLRRSAADDKPDGERRKPAAPYDPAATAGVRSDYYRRRVAAEKMATAAAAAAALAANAPPPIASDPGAIRSNLDEATPELRRRIFEAASATARPRRLPRAMAWLLAGGVSVLLWLGIGELIDRL